MNGLDTHSSDESKTGECGSGQNGTQIEDTRHKHECEWEYEENCRADKLETSRDNSDGLYNILELEK